MEVSQPAGGGKRGKRGWMLALGAVVTIGALYAVGWQVAATHLRGKLLSALAGQDAGDLAVECRNARMGGFPFSMRLTCEGLAADDVEHGVSTTLGPAEAKISLFSPGRVRSTLNGPVEIRSSHGMFVGEWTALASDIDFGLSGMQSFKVEAQALKANFAEQPAGGTFLQASTERFSGVADGGSGDLTASLSMEGTRLARNGAELRLPPLKLDAALRVAGRGDLVGRFDREGLYGTQGEIDRFTASLGEGRDFTVSGPFSVDGEGRISGRFRVEAKKFADWIEAARQTVPEAAPMIETAAGLIRSFTKGSADLTVDLTLREGKVFVAGFIPVGEIPPL